MAILRVAFRIHVEPRIGQLRLDEVTARRLTRLYRDIEQDAGVSVSTVWRVHATVRRMLHYAVKWEHLPANPARYADLPKATDRRDRIHAWTPEQLHRFFNIAREHRWRSLRRATPIGEALARERLKPELQEYELSNEWRRA